MEVAVGPTDGLGVMLIQRVALLSVVDLGREGVQGGTICLPLSLLYLFPFHPGSGWFPHEVTTKIDRYLWIPSRFTLSQRRHGTHPATTTAGHVAVAEGGPTSNKQTCLLEDHAQKHQHPTQQRATQEEYPLG